MYPYKNLLVPLNLTTTDEAAIRFSSQISLTSKSENAYFIHVKRPSEIPQQILDEYPQLLVPSEEERKQKMQSQVEVGWFESPDTNVVFQIEAGTPLEVLLEHIVKKDIDLVVIGRKTEAKDTRRLPINLARKAPCSVLVVPENSKHTISNILVPIDFSEFALNALEQAVNLAFANNISTIQCVNVFQLPIGYYKTGKSQEEFQELMKKNAIKDYERFVKKIDLKGVEVNPIFLHHDKPAQAIQSVVENNKVDLLVLGTRGRNAGAGLLLGSVTEDIILNTRIPLMAVKKKGTGLSLLEVLLKHL
ncbi:MAG: universal stress protein [Marinoscillum sp.]